MMNPQFMPPGQNNNAPMNPLGYQTNPQDVNGHQNANMFSQMPSNGPSPQMMNPNDMAQKMQSMNLNAPPAFSNITPSQLPPGVLPPGANFNQLPPGGNAQPGFPGRPQAGVPPQQLPPSMNQQKPPTSTQNFSQMPPGQAPSVDQSRNFAPPQGPGSFQQGPKPMQPPNSQPSQPGLPGQPGQMPPGLSQQPSMARMPPPSGMPPQPGQIPMQQLLPQQGMPPKPDQAGPPQNFQRPSSQPSIPPQQGQVPFQPPSSQSGLPPSSQAGYQSQGLPPSSQPGFQSQGLPPSSQPGFQSQGLPPSSQPGFQSQGLPPQPGMPPSQPSYQSQPPPPSSQAYQSQPPRPGMPPSQPGLPPQPAMPPSQPGLPPQPAMPQPGMPPVSQAQFNQGFQQPSLPGMPHMPPPLSQQQRQYPGMAPANAQPAFGTAPPVQPGYPGMPPMQQTQALPGQPPVQPRPMLGQPPMQQQSSGYPPQYHQPPFPAQQPSYPGQYEYQQQQQQKRLDPDQMPSPIQVMLDDQQNRGGIFVTNEKGLVPPLVTTDFIVDDKGNASPRYIRSSMYSIPVTAELLKQTAMPFCLVISPMAETEGSESEPPLLDFAALTGSPTMGPVRCSRCKAYMCPNMKFLDAGRHFKCAFCKATTEVPMEYTQYVNSMQQYGRVPAEMALGAYEILATKEYCRNNTLPNPPAIIFLIDVSYNSVKNGLLQTVCDNILDIIESISRSDPSGKTRVGFITYSSTVHFYNIKGTLGQPQMLSVGDVGDMFVPLLEGFLQTPEESGMVLPALVRQLPEIFANNKETETILLPAVQAGLEALKAADTSGQLLVFHTSLPTYPAPGKLNNREDRKLLGTDKEKQMLSPQTTEYNEVGQACAAAGVSVEMFVANNSYVDVATIGQLPRLTGGQLHKFTYFTAELDGPRLAAAAARVCARATAHDAVMRVRASTGVRATDFFGHFFMANTTDVELAAIDADKAVGVELKHDDKLTGEDGVYIQAALLYTHRNGQRRLRILNLALNVAHQLADVYRSAELDTIVNFLTRQAVWALRDNPPRAVREGLTARCVRSLAAYRRHCATPSAPGQLVLPESMKLLPLYTSCLLRGDALSGGPELTCDERACAMSRALVADVGSSAAATYPRLLPLHTLPAAPTPLRASVDKMRDHGVYLLENGVHMLIWVGSQAPPEFCRDVFGVPSPQQVDTQVCELPELENELSVAARAIIDDARAKRRSPMRLTIMRQHDKLEAVLRHFLVEDRGVDGSASYVDYLCHIHKEIRALL